jgi:DNA polymerase-3 subunit gamma/tau
LVHLRRLLPIEEVLSQFPVAGGAGPAGMAGKVAAAAPAVLPTRNAPVTPAPAVSAKPAFSPFEQDKNRSRFEERSVAAPASVASSTPRAVEPLVAPVAVPVAIPEPVVLPETIATPREMGLTNGDVVEVGHIEASAPAEVHVEVAVETPPSNHEESLQPAPLHSAEALQKAATDALAAAKNQDTPADALSDAEWVVVDNEIRVQTELSKTMLPMVINSEAEKIVKAALRDAGAGALKLVLLPGVKKAATDKKARAPRSGSVQAKAMEHPIVQRAQTLFNAEIRNVIDLRDGD